MPNLFTYATKELSQDAMICWLIEWSAVQVANESQQALRDLGRAFVQALLGKHRVNLAGAIRHAEIHQQDRSIDVLARIQDEHAGHVFLIEDKTGTKDTSDKLQRYQDAVSSGKTKLGEVPEHWPIYLKTGNQSHAEDRKVEEIGYKGSVAEKGRVGGWRGSGRRMGVAVPGGFRNAGASLPAITPFPVAAHRSGHADLLHPALGRDHAFAHGRPAVRSLRRVRP